MRWVVLILNLLTAAGIFFFAEILEGVQRAYAMSVYQEFEEYGVLPENPETSDGEPFDAQTRFERVSRKGNQVIIGGLGAAACVVNGLLFFFFCSPQSSVNQAETVTRKSCEPNWTE